MVRQEKAYPVYDDSLCRQCRSDAVRNWKARYPTLHMVGRNGMHRYNNQDHAMMTAMLTVENIEANARIYNIWNVNEDAEYHEAGDEGEQEAIAAAAKVALTEDQAVALASERDVPVRVESERPRKVA